MCRLELKNDEKDNDDYSFAARVNLRVWRRYAAAAVLSTNDGCYSADRVITFRFIFHNIVFLFVFVAYFRMLTILNNKWPHKSTIKNFYLKE